MQSWPAATRKPQSLAIVLKAELRRLVRRGGMRLGIVISIIIGVVAGLATLSLIGFFSQESDPSTIAITLPAEVGATLAIVSLSVVVVAATTRDFASGLFLSSLSLTPRRVRLSLARLFAIMIAGGLVTGIVATVVGLVAIATAGVGLDGGPLAALVVACAFAAGSLMAAFAAAIATIVQRPVVAIICLLAILFALPLAVATLAPILPAEFLPSADWLVNVMPFTLVSRILGITTLVQLGWQPVVLALAGLSVWAAGATALAMTAVARRDA